MIHFKHIKVQVNIYTCRYTLLCVQFSSFRVQLFIYSRLSRSFNGRGSVSGVPTKGIGLISSRVTKQSQRYNKNTCLTSVKHSFISSLRLAAVLRSGKAHENIYAKTTYKVLHTYSCFPSPGELCKR